MAVKLSDGSVLLYNPVAPTREFFSLLDEATGGAEVRWIVCGSYAIEHFTFMADAHRQFPDAGLYVTPKKRTPPVDLPLKLLGVLVLFYVLHREHAMRLTCRVCRSLAGLAQTLRLPALTNALLGAARAASF